MTLYTLQKEKGFTLIELLVVIAIIGLLSSVIFASLNSVRAKARDAQRRSDMKQIQVALETYRLDNGRYPVTSTWHGYLTTGCGNAGGRTGATGYIPNLAPNYIPVLPIDPRGIFGSCSGYLYRSDGSNYKLLSHVNGPESFPSAGQEFHDPIRPTSAWMLCSGGSACSW